MSDIIKLLPDSIANQIAAGEVVPRPSSVVKELVENALDAGADDISIIIKDAGRTLIQIIDNGSGMSPTDARIAFERHATSKIREASDLFRIRTMGFRGEALASIASVSHVSLKTRKQDEELGTHIEIEGSVCTNQEAVACSGGSNFSVKNLFFNVPARRKFLKSNSTELRHISNEVYRIALTNPNISFQFTHNETSLLKLSEGNLLQRIGAIFGKRILTRLLRVEVETELVRIKGYIGNLDQVKKSNEQFFFVNNRYTKSPYLHKAVMVAYDQLIPSGMQPAYFIYMEVEPDTVDINIHPTKTEIKLEHEKEIWAILLASVRESLGKFNVIPSIDFDTAGKIDFPTISTRSIDFEAGSSQPTSRKSFSQGGNAYTPSPSPARWGELYGNERAFTEPEEVVIPSKIGEEPSLITENTTSGTEYDFYQYKRKYIFTPTRSGLMIIHQYRAHYRVLYEKYMSTIDHENTLSQKLLFPVLLDLPKNKHQSFLQLEDKFRKAGFEFNTKGEIELLAFPSGLEGIDYRELLLGMINELEDEVQTSDEYLLERLAGAMARSAAIKAGKKLSQEEMKDLLDQLFSCKVQLFSPDGKPVLTVHQDTDIDKEFN